MNLDNLSKPVSMDMLKDKLLSYRQILEAVKGGDVLEEYLFTKKEYNDLKKQVSLLTEEVQLMKEKLELDNSKLELDKFKCELDTLNSSMKQVKEDISYLLENDKAMTSEIRSEHQLLEETNESSNQEKLLESSNFIETTEDTTIAQNRDENREYEQKRDQRNKQPSSFSNLKSLFDAQVEAYPNKEAIKNNSFSMENKVNKFQVESNGASLTQKGKNPLNRLHPKSDIKARSSYQLSRKKSSEKQIQKKFTMESQTKKE
ncbi:hypothetical protein ACERII_06545 [Evansella sp. AB-rgal1]|uniref:hypothetical protein n=1 Tax=Evansella sp. AB-rgal1 TaxID=3242696 RepID=UPI00359DD227